MKWLVAQLDSVCEMQAGFAFASSSFRTDRIGLPIIRIQNVGSGGLDDFVYWDQPYDNRYVVRGGDILLSLSGSFRVATWQGENALLNQRVVKLAPGDAIHPSWLFRSIQQLLPRIEAMGRHALVNNVSLQDLRMVQIPLPPLPEQRRIADILDKADSIRRKRKEAITLTEELLRSAFLEMFGDPVRNPKGWPVRPLGELADVHRGRFTPRPRNDPQFYGGTFPFIQTGDLTNSSGYLRTWKQTLNEKGCTVSRGFPRGSIAITIAANIGDTAIIDFDFWCPDSVVGIVSRSVPSEYLEMHLRFQQAQLEAGAPETAQKNINLETLRPLAIMTPPTSLVENFARLYRQCYNLAARYGVSLAESECFFSSLVDRAFRGELKAPSTPSASKNKQISLFGD